MQIATGRATDVDQSRMLEPYLAGVLVVRSDTIRENVYALGSGQTVVGLHVGRVEWNLINTLLEEALVRFNSSTVDLRIVSMTG